MLENIAVTKNEKDAFIGHLFWYSISDDLYSRQELRNTLKNQGLSEGFMPNEIRPVDAFRRATKEVETRVAVNDKLYENFLVRDVYSDVQVAVRHIVKETVDSQGKRLSYNEKEAVIVLDKKSNTIQITATPDSVAERQAQKAVELFDIFKEHHNGQAVRGMVQSILRTMSPTPMRPSGGIYFIPSTHADTLIKLVNFCSAFAKGEGFKVPVVESKDNIDMVAKKVGDHLDGILNQCRGALADGTLTKSKLQELLSDARTTVASYKDYENMLTQQQEDMDKRIQEIRDTMMLLMDKSA
jgi:hypothetical protein